MLWNFPEKHIKRCIFISTFPFPSLVIPLRRPCVFSLFHLFKVLGTAKLYYMKRFYQSVIQLRKNKARSSFIDYGRLAHCNQRPFSEIPSLYVPHVIKHSIAHGKYFVCFSVWIFCTWPPVVGWSLDKSTFKEIWIRLLFERHRIANKRHL